MENTTPVTAVTSPAPAPTLPTGWRANPVVVRLMSLHFWLGFSALVVAVLKSNPKLAAYKDALDYLFDALVPGSIFAASIYKPPVDRAKIAHVDNVGFQTPTVTPPSPPTTPLLILLLIPALIASGCASWPEIARISATSLERSFVEVSAASKSFNIKKQDEYRARFAKAATNAELQKITEEHATYEAKYNKLVDALNKTWAVISSVSAALPLATQLADKQKRAEISALITNGLALIMQVKDALSAFGVQIGVAG